MFKQQRFQLLLKTEEQCRCRDTRQQAVPHMSAMALKMWSAIVTRHLWYVERWRQQRTDAVECCLPRSDVPGTAVLTMQATEDNNSKLKLYPLMHFNQQLDVYSCHIDCSFVFSVLRYLLHLPCYMIYYLWAFPICMPMETQPSGHWELLSPGIMY